VANDAVAEAFAQAIRRGDEVRDPLRWVTKAAYRIAAGELQLRRRGDYPLAEGSYEGELWMSSAPGGPSEIIRVDPQAITS
jgi:hypothetical protein